MGSGLDTRGATDGFMRGFNFVEGHYDRQHQRQRQEALDTQNSQLLGMKKEQFEMGKADRQHKQDRTRIQEGLEIALQGSKLRPDASWRDLVAPDVQTLLDKPENQTLNPDWLLSREGQWATQQAGKVMDPNTPDAYDDPNSVKAMDILFSGDINTDREGKPLKGHRSLNMVLPGKKKGHMAFDLKMEDGSTNPMTERRGSEADGDNSVLEVPVNDLIQKASGIKQLQAIMAAKGWAPKAAKPIIQEFYDENGQPYKAQYDMANGGWLRVGGSKAAKAGKLTKGIHPETGKPAFFHMDGQNQPVWVDGAAPVPGIRVNKDGSIEIGGGGSPTDLGKPAVNDAQERVISNGESLARLDHIAKNYDRDFLTWQGKAQDWLSNVRSKAGVSLPKNERDMVRKYRKFTQGVNYEFNAYRKLITGAAAAVAELEDLKKAMISTDLSPDQFEGAFNEYREELSRTMRIRNKLLREGLSPGTKQYGEALDQLYLTSGDDNLDDRGTELEESGASPEDIIKTLEQEGYL